MVWQQSWFDRFYRSQPGWTDGTADFHDLCRSCIPSGGRVLEIGAGPTNRTSEFLSTFGELYGVDVSEEVLGNKFLAKAAVATGDHYPFADASFDVAVSNYVVEHVEDPVSHLAEIRRVLKPGGFYVFRTPNLWHYVALVARLTSHRFHLKVANRLRTNGPDHHDPWPTVYAMNTRRRVAALAREAGLQVRSLQMVEKEPSYGMYARPLFLTFMAYERVVNASPRLEDLRSNIFAVLKKPAAAS
jgi:SAM-dependent methyltransferase